MKPTILITLTTQADEAQAVSETVKQLEAVAAGARICGGLLFSGEGHDASKLQQGLASRLPGTPFAGVSGVSGAATRAGAAEGTLLAGLWIAGEGMSFGAACAADAAEALDAALARADVRLFKARFVMAHAAGATAGLGKVLTEQVGRSRALGGIVGAQAVWSDAAVLESGVVLAVSDWPWQLGAAMRAPLKPAGKRGLVTRAADANVLELDGKPALDVYAGWTGADAEKLLSAKGALEAPLGLVRGYEYDEEIYAVLQPRRAIAETRGLELAESVREGDEVVLLAPRPEAAAAGREAVVAAVTRFGLRPDGFVGGLLLCEPAGAEPKTIAEGFAEAMGEAPMLAVFAHSLLASAAPRRIEAVDLSANAMLLSSDKDRSEG